MKTGGRARARPIDLSRNEGAPPGRDWLAALERHGPAAFNEYDNAEILELLYAKRLGVEPDRVLATNGADEAIDRFFRAFLAPGETVIHPAPTFVMIDRFARISGGHPVPVEYEWGSLPHDRIMERVTDETGAVAVISPDNPTGAAFSAESLTALARALPDGVMLLADLAYVEFADEDPTQALLERSNVVVVRTMSKAWGLAGLRIGFAVGDSDAIRAMRRCGGPYSLATPSIVVGIGRFARGDADVRERVRCAKVGRERLSRLVREVGGKPYPSQTNFVLARFPDVHWISYGLAAQAIRVRTFEDLPQHVRITVPRNDAEHSRLEGALRCLAKPEALLFDMDGVLADVRRSYRETIVRTCAAFGVETTAERVDEAAKSSSGGHDDWALTRKLLAECGVEVDQARVTRRFEEIYQGTEEEPGLRRRETLIPDPRLLARLAERFKMAVVTGRPRSDAERFLREHSIADLFGAVVCREDAPMKPLPAPVELALARLEADTAWMLGDTIDDLAAARGSGVVPIIVASPVGADGDAARGLRLRNFMRRRGAARVVDANANYGGLFDD